MADNIVEVALVGDTFGANLNYKIGWGLASEFYQNDGKKWDKPLAKLLDADLAFCNLESPIIHDIDYCTNNGFAAPPNFASFLKKIGINIVSLANNHILEQGEKGFFSTMDILGLNEIKFVGQKTKQGSNVEIFERNGIRIGFSGYNEINNIPNPGLYAELEKSSILASLGEMERKKVDFKFVSLHWGDEYISKPSSNQIQLAHELIDAGADVIVGHHPHVIQPVERYKHGLIFYSLGNFFMDMTWCKSCRVGIKADVLLCRNESPQYKLTPVCFDKDFNLISNTRNKHSAYITKINSQNYLDKFRENHQTYTRYYKKTQKRLHNLQKIYSWLFLLNNWSKLSPTTKDFIKAGLRSKLFLT